MPVPNWNLSFLGVTKYSCKVGAGIFTHTIFNQRANKTDDREVVCEYVIDTTADYYLLCKQERVRNGVKIVDLKGWVLFLESFVIGGFHNLHKVSDQISQLAPTSLQLISYFGYMYPSL